MFHHPYYGLLSLCIFIGAKVIIIGAICTNISATIGAKFIIIGAICSNIGATIGANLRFIGAIIGATIGANTEFIYDIIYDTKRFTMTLVLLSMTSNIGNADSNNQSNFFNSSTSGRASRNFSGISSLSR